MADKPDRPVSGGVMTTTLPQPGEGGRVPDSNVLPIGTRLGEFEINGVVGEGGFGIVYLARDRSLERTVAVKEYMPSTIAGRSGGLDVVVKAPRHAETFDAGLRSFINEARLLARFDHPNLVKVYRFWEANSTAYMVMPFYDGQTLKQRLRELGGPPGETWLKRVLMPVLDVLELMHSEQCYHRDIAPDNILILPGDRSLLLDFGAARQVIGDRTQALTVILKPGYAPVEQYAEAADMRQGAWTDIYALAAVWYLAITGRVPPTSVARLMQDKMPALAQQGQDRYSPALLAALDHALRVRPEDRYQTIGEFRTALITADDNLTIAPTVQELGLPRTATPTATPPSLLPAARSQPSEAQAAKAVKRGDLAASDSRRAYPRAGVAGVVAILIASGGLFWWWNRPQVVPPVAQELPKIDPKKVEPETTEPQPPEPPVVVRPKPLESPTPPVIKPVLPPLTPDRMLTELHAGRDLVWTVTARATPARLRIGRDRLRLTVTSDQPGHVYLIALGTDGRQLALLFPNAVDRNNQIAAKKPMDLPRAGWAVTAAGPPGINRFVVIVADSPRDWTASGLGTQQPFAEFDFARMQAAYAARGTAGLQGTANCPPSTGPSTLGPPPTGPPKCGMFGAGTFQVEEFE